MKKTFKFFLAVAFTALTVGLVGCSKDAEDLIIGDWDVQNMVYSYTISGLTGDYAVMNGTNSDTITMDPGESATISFKKDGTVTLVNVSEGETETDNGTYTIKDNKLTMTVDNDPQTYDITKISKSELVLTASESIEEYDEDLGQTYKMEMTLILNLKKH